MRMSTIGLAAHYCKSIIICGYCFWYLYQSTAVMLPVTLFAVNADNLILTLPLTLCNSRFIGLVSKVSTRAFRT